MYYTHRRPWDRGNRMKKCVIIYIICTCANITTSWACAGITVPETCQDCKIKKTRKQCKITCKACYRSDDKLGAETKIQFEHPDKIKKVVIIVDD